jgi:pyruvate dehydrogenase E2 component (dihydrolipoamide acetyltransferase)
LSIKMVMPKLGLNMKEGKILEWYKKEGDKVSKGEAVLSVETDKVATDVDAPGGGILSRAWGQKGDTVCVGQVVALISQEGEDITDVVAQIENGFSPKNLKCDQIDIFIKGADLQAEHNGLTEPKIRITPKARKIASERKIDFNLLQNKFQDKRITEKDIEEFLQEMDSVEPATTVISFTDKDKRIKLSSMRKAIAQKMLLSTQKTASATNAVEVDVTAIRALLKQIKDEKQLDISLTAFLIKTASILLEEYPIFNAALLEEEQEILIHGDINIGCAVDVSDGLLVPVVKNANLKSLKEIAAEISELAKKARSGNLSFESLQGGTFTISNLGMFDMDFIIPVINYPEVAILGIGAAKLKPCYINNELVPVPREMLFLTLTYDHRVIDGAPASRFLKKMKEYIEDYYIMVTILR